MIRAHFFRNRRARPDEAHVALEHIPELRKLVEREAPQNSANPRDARIRFDLEHRAAHLVQMTDFAETLVRVGDHRAEFVERERAAIESDSLLFEEHRTGRCDLDRDGRQNDHRRGERQDHERDADVKHSFRGQLRLVRGRGREGQERDSFQLFDLDAREPVLEEIHRDARANAELLAQQEDLLHLIELLARHREHDLVDDLRKLAILEQRADLGHRPVHAKSRPAVRQAVPIGDESQDFVAPVFVVFDQPRDIDRATARADDQYRAVVESLCANVTRHDAQRDLLEDEKKRRQDREEDEPGARKLSQRQQVRQRREQDVADRDDAENRQHFPLERQRAMAVITVVTEQQHRPDDQHHRIDLEIVLEGKEAGGETIRREDRQQQIANPKCREEGYRGQTEVDQVHDPRDHSPLLLKH